MFMFSNLYESHPILENEPTSLECKPKYRMISVGIQTHNSQLKLVLDGLIQPLGTLYEKFVQDDSSR